MDRLRLLDRGDIEYGAYGTLTDRVKDTGDASPSKYEAAIVACGYGKFNYLLLAGLVPMCASQLFSSGSVALALPTAQCDLALQDFQKGTLNAATYLGNIAAGLIWGGLSDMFGRKMIVVMCFLVDFVVSLACSFAHTYWLLLLLKILAGVVIAGPNTVLFAYLAETHDDKHRGFVVMANGMAFAFVQIVQPVIAYLLLPLDFRIILLEGVLDITSWRVFFMVCSLPSLISSLWFHQLPESPKFLMSKGKEQEALEVFRRIYLMNTGKAGDTYPVKSLFMSEAPKSADGRELKGWRRAVQQFKPQIGRAHV